MTVRNYLNAMSRQLAAAGLCWAMWVIPWAVSADEGWRGSSLIEVAPLTHPDSGLSGCLQYIGQEYGGLIVLAALMLLLQAILIAFLSINVMRRRRAECALRLSEEKFKALFTSFPQGIVVSGADGCFMEVNARAEQLSGLPRDEWCKRCLGQDGWGLLTPDGAPLAVEDYPGVRAFKEQRVVAHQRVGLARGDASPLWLDVTAAPIAHPRFGVVLTFSDITALVEAKQGRIRSEHTFQRFFEQSGAYSYMLTPDGTITEINTLAQERLGYSRQELLGGKVVDIFAPEDRSQLAVMLTRSAAGQEVAAQDFTIIDQQQRRHRVLTSLVRVDDQNGTFLHAAMVQFDITEYKQIEERFRILYQYSPVGIVMVEPETKTILHCNRSFAEICGYTEQELVGMSLKAITHPEDWQRSLDRTGRYISPFHGDFTDEHRYQRKDGTFRWVRIHGVLLELNRADELLAVGLVEDITEQRAGQQRQEELERHLAQVHRLEAIGMLAGGVAHDFNNILFPISGNAELLQEELAADSDKQELVNEILTAVDRARDLVGQILAFSSQPDEEPEPVQPLLIVREVLRFLEGTLPRTIQIKQRLDPECRMIMVCPAQMHQLVMNLFLQAYHAMMSAGGTLTAGLNTLRLEQEEAARLQLPVGDYVCLSVEDTGSPLGRERLLAEQAHSQGAVCPLIGGLEMGQLYRDAQKQGADIHLERTVDGGMRCEVYFPVYRTRSPLDGARASVSPRRSLLIVDDEESVLRLAQQLLQRLGYRVTAVRDAAQALEIFGHAPMAFDAVITDMVMPQMNGDKLVTALLEQRADLPVIVITGAQGSITREQALALGAKDLLKKPITAEQLARALALVLD